MKAAESFVERPIPAFYCCYLLRSKNRKSYYIGSTPNPARRLGQHNGSSKGGAKHTALQGKRPWEMTCIVTGFPSRFAALQFEWAWQNTHATRHIVRDVRDARAEELHKKSKAQTGKRRRPPMSLEARLKNLHHLLGVASFNRWPLHARFFAPDVFAAWEKHGSKLPSLRDSIKVQLTPSDLPTAQTWPSGDLQGFKIPDVIQDMDISYRDCAPQLEKTKIVLKGSTLICTICRKSLRPTNSLILVCPMAKCSSLAHVQCLARHFLAEEGTKSSLIPLQGHCPSCQTLLQWSALVRELSLRTRGESEIEAMRKPSRRKRAINANGQENAGLPQLETDDSELDETWMEEVDDGDEVFEIKSL